MASFLEHNKKSRFKGRPNITKKDLLHGRPIAFKSLRKWNSENFKEMLPSRAPELINKALELAERGDSRVLLALINKILPNCDDSSITLNAQLGIREDLLKVAERICEEENR